MMSKLIQLILLLLTINLYSQKDTLIDNSIFIFTRSSESKVNFIAKDFNISDTLTTHVGIGIKKNGEYLIYNVTNDKKLNGSSLICENLESFINSHEVKHYSIWELTINKAEYDTLLNIIENYASTSITFDYNFLIKDNNELYCSEFVWIVLSEVNEKKFFYEPIGMELRGFYEYTLKRSFLHYIPVDFFLSYNLFKKVEERFVF